ncbi:biotin/lipoyl-containing protein, partial [Micrococcus sp. HMSC067E09]|uniref:biotin/lipoyl-containing protein n=1 Tax=Micrococcus sp. HMSC067E09 TaxID=1739367 RepID=UPI00273893B7
WLKEVGDEVEVDEPLLEVSTDKVDTEIPSPVAGVLEEILVEEDDTVEVGAPLATIGDGEGGGSSDDSDDDAEAEEDASDAEEDASEAAAADESDDSDDSEEKEEVKADKGSSSGETTEVTLPALGESVTEGTISRWLKEVGDEV